MLEGLQLPKKNPPGWNELYLKTQAFSKCFIACFIHKQRGDSSVGL